MHGQVLMRWRTGVGVLSAAFAIGGGAVLLGSSTSSAKAGREGVVASAASATTTGTTTSPIASDGATSTDWEYVGHDRNNDRYAPETQINTSNVSKLKLAWTAGVGVVPGGCAAGFAKRSARVAESCPPGR